MIDRNVFSNLFAKYNNFIDYKYVNSDVAFTRNGKVSLESAIKYPLCNNKKTTSIEVNKFIRNELGDNTMSLTKSGISDRMQYIEPQVYIDMNDVAVVDLYNNPDETALFKGFNVTAIDASIIEIPNVKLTREEFGIPENTKLKTYKSSARISCMVDTQRDYILSSNITYKDMSELEHALFHLNDVKNKIDLKKTITLYDRGYNSTELMVKTIQLESYFVIRGKKSMLKKNQKIMEKTGKTDEIFKINLNNNKVKRFHSPELKEYANKIKHIKVRIVKVKLKNGTIETLLTNLPKEIANPEELKELYNDRWTIEKNYDRLKNKLQIEKFSGRRKITIEQDFYSHILIFNTLIAIKNDAEQNIKRKPQKNNKYKYKSNINRLIGEIKEQMPSLLNEDKKEVQKIVDNIMEIGSKDLVYTKINSPTNEKRDKNKYYHKKCKSNLKESF